MRCHLERHSTLAHAGFPGRLRSDGRRRSLGVKVVAGPSDYEGVIARAVSVGGWVVVDAWNGSVWVRAPDISLREVWLGTPMPDPAGATP